MSAESSNKIISFLSIVVIVLCVILIGTILYFILIKNYVSKNTSENPKEYKKVLESLFSKK